jgi:UDP-N-acetylmuramate--alanine ligase
MARSPEADLVLKAARVDGSVTVFDANLGERVHGGARSLKDWSVPIPGEHNAAQCAGGHCRSASEAGDRPMT